MIRDHMPDQHREFFTLLPWLLVGSVDAQGQPWASVLAGNAGFVSSPDAFHLSVQSQALPADTLRNNLRLHAPVGILGMQSHTRRRNRMNGVIEQLDKHGFSVRVQQSFGNCPKYIQAREPEFIGALGNLPAAEHLQALDAAAVAMIENADTFFIATSHPAVIEQDGQTLQSAQGVDISHRGGKPGFVRVEGNTLLVPDYLGNFFFNTIGNLLLERRAGLLFIDFSNGSLLQLSVRAEVIGEGVLLAQFPEAQRLLRMEVTAAIRHPAALPLRWGAVSISPFL